MKYVNLLFGNSDKKLRYIDLTQEFSGKDFYNATDFLTLKMENPRPDSIPGGTKWTPQTPDALITYTSEPLEFKNAGDDIIYLYQESDGNITDIPVAGTKPKINSVTTQYTQNTSYGTSGSSSKIYFSVDDETDKSGIFSGLYQTFYREYILDAWSQQLSLSFPFNLRRRTNGCGYTYLARFTANRRNYKYHRDDTNKIIYDGEVLYSPGYCLLKCSQNIIAGKEYKLVTNHATYSAARRDINANRNNVDNYIFVWYVDQYLETTIGYTQWGGGYYSKTKAPYLFKLETAITKSSDDWKEVDKPMLDMIGKMFTVYATTNSASVKNFHDAFWSQEFRASDDVKSLGLLNLTDNIITFGAIPVNMPGNWTDGDGVQTIDGVDHQVTIGGINIGSVVSKEIYMSEAIYQFPVIRSQVYRFNPPITAKGFDYLNYAPYTSISICIPFCGTYELDPSDVLDRYIYFEYRFDLLTGDCGISIYRTKTKGLVAPPDTTSDQWQRLTTYNGNCLINVPLSSGNFGLKQMGVMQSMMAAEDAAIKGIVGGSKIAIGIAGAGVTSMQTGGSAQFGNRTVSNGAGGLGQSLMDFRKLIKTQRMEDAYNPTATVKYGGGSMGTQSYLHKPNVRVIIKFPKVSAEMSNTYNKFYSFSRYENESDISNKYVKNTLFIASDIRKTANVSGIFPNNAEFEEMKLLFMEGVIL